MTLPPPTVAPCKNCGQPVVAYDPSDGVYILPNVAGEPVHVSTDLNQPRGWFSCGVYADPTTVAEWPDR